MRSAIFITARTKSTRLPKKVLIPIKGQTVIEHLIDRVSLAKLPDEIVVCTSTNTDDDILIRLAEKKGVQYFRGSEDDVVERFVKAAQAFAIDFIVVTWGDELFCDPEYIDKTIELFKKTGADFIKCDDLPLGTFTYGVKTSALKKVYELKKDTDTEVWGGYFTKSNMFHVETLPVENKDFRHPEIRITLDYPEDLKLIEVIFDRLYKGERVFSLREIIDLLEREPEFMEINKHCQEFYEKRIQDQAKQNLTV